MDTGRPESIAQAFAYEIYRYPELRSIFEQSIAYLADKTLMWDRWRKGES